jgi:hypothetical protein
MQVAVLIMKAHTVPNLEMNMITPRIRLRGPCLMIKDYILGKKI